MLSVMFDEMYEGKAEELRSKGYESVSVRELRDMGFKETYRDLISQPQNGKGSLVNPLEIKSRFTYGQG